MKAPTRSSPRNWPKPQPKTATPAAPADKHPPKNKKDPHSKKFSTAPPPARPNAQPPASSRAASSAPWASAAKVKDHGSDPIAADAANSSAMRPNPSAAKPNPSAPPDNYHKSRNPPHPYPQNSEPDTGSCTLPRQAPDTGSSPGSASHILPSSPCS